MSTLSNSWLSSSWGAGAQPSCFAFLVLQPSDFWSSPHVCFLWGMVCTQISPKSDPELQSEGIDSTEPGHQVRTGIPYIKLKDNWWQITELSCRMFKGLTTWGKQTVSETITHALIRTQTTASSMTHTFIFFPARKQTWFWSVQSSVTSYAKIWGGGADLDIYLFACLNSPV